ncbi:MAG TPA: hypothetical protein VKS99_12105 [Blastocatellia bacterium]|nr:hypothetical protein [Blastocatellia bacterium]
MIEEARKSIESIRKGNPIECSAEEYRSGIRAVIILFALDCADGKDELRMRTALAEVKRLDKMHGFGRSAKSSVKGA